MHDGVDVDPARAVDELDGRPPFRAWLELALAVQREAAVAVAIDLTGLQQAVRGDADLDDQAGCDRRHDALALAERDVHAAAPGISLPAIAERPTAPGLAWVTNSSRMPSARHSARAPTKRCALTATSTSARSCAVDRAPAPARG